MAKPKKTYKVGRDAETGQFIPLKDAKRRKKTAVVETIKRQFLQQLFFGGFMPPFLFEWNLMKNKDTYELTTLMFEVATELTRRSKEERAPCFVKFPRGQIRTIQSLKARWPYLSSQLQRTLACNIQLCDINQWQLNTWKIGLTAGTMWEWQCTLPVISTIEALMFGYGEYQLNYSTDINFKKIINKLHADQVITLKLRDEIHQLREFRNEIHLFLKGNVELYDNLPKHYNNACRLLVELEHQIEKHWYQ